MNNFDQFLFNYHNINSGDIFSHTVSTTLVANAPCNLNCGYCYLDKCHNQKVFEFLPEKLEPVLSPFAHKENENIAIWMGEPLYNKDLFIKVCNFVNTILPNHKIIIYTNGTLLDDWWADFFKDHKVYIKLSHDGPGQKYRGFDYMKSDSHIKAIQNIYKNGNLCGVNTTVHKYNCSALDIINFFTEFEKKYNIIFNTQSRCLVGLNLANTIVYDFDFMSKDLIQYIIDTYSFLFKSLLTNNLADVKKYFPPDSISDTLPILKSILQVPVINEHKSCNKHSIAIDGRPFCIYSAYSKSLPKVCYSNVHTIDRPLKCHNCIINKTCPNKSCLKVSLNDSCCDKIIARYKTVYAALELLIDNFKN